MKKIIARILAFIAKKFNISLMINVKIENNNNGYKYCIPKYYGIITKTDLHGIILQNWNRIIECNLSNMGFPSNKEIEQRKEIIIGQKIEDLFYEGNGNYFVITVIIDGQENEFCFRFMGDIIRE